MWYANWSSRPGFPVHSARRLEHLGIVPMITWEPWLHGSRMRQITLRGIARGRYDPYIRRYARRIRRYGGPLFLRPMHEMDGNWYPWAGSRQGNSPSLFVRAWRHMHRVFDRVGATNTTWVWCVNQWSVPHTRENTIGRYWPGRRFVDWAAVSVFNAGPVRSPFRWQSFDAIFGARYVQLLRYRRPIMVAELGAPERGGDKAGWISDAFHSLRVHYAGVGAVVWYDQRDARHPSVGDWRIDSSARSLAAFRRAIHGDRVLSAPAAVERTLARL
jgi:beta-mannanase